MSKESRVTILSLLFHFLLRDLYSKKIFEKAKTLARRILKYYLQKTNSIHFYAKQNYYK